MIKTTKPIIRLCRECLYWKRGICKELKVSNVYTQPYDTACRYFSDKIN